MDLPKFRGVGRAFGILGLLAALTLSVAAQPPRSAAQQPQHIRLPAAVSGMILTTDGWTLAYDYYYPYPDSTPTAKTQNTATVILLHGVDGNRQVWDSLARKLQRHGMAAIAVDLRKHGESQAPPGYPGSTSELNPADFAAMAALDLVAIKRLLLTEHEKKRINIRKTGIIAADKMVPVAMAFAVGDWLRQPFPDAPTLAASTPRGQDIRAIAMLSPSESAGRINATQLARLLRNDAWMVAAWIGIGAEDRKDNEAAKSIYDLLTSSSPAAKNYVKLNVFDRVKVRGTELLNLRGVDVESQLVQFMERYLKAIPVPWRTRISPLLQEGD